MTNIISQDLVERHVSILPFIPDEWEHGEKMGYKLDLKMCHIKMLIYDFVWGEEPLPPPAKATVVNTPYKVLVLDLSLNDLTEVFHKDLAVMPQIRVLDLSLNRIKRCLGVEVLKWLYHLNLAHNFITKIEGLNQCRLLAELNLSMNQIDDLRVLPTLSNLSVLRINNNKIISLNGIQNLGYLKELYCQRNMIRDLIPLSGNKRLITLNASDNQVSSLHDTVEVLKNLHFLRSASLYGNPIDQEYNYHTKILDATSITGLDNVNIRPAPRLSQGRDNHYTIKDAARQAFLDQLKDRRNRTQQNIEFLQGRIVALQQEYQEYEDKINHEMEACIRYMDNLGPEQLERYDVTEFRRRFDTPAARPWEQVPYIPLHGSRNDELGVRQSGSVSPRSPRKHHGPKKDYSDVKQTDEVLRNACNELIEAFPTGESPDPPSRTPDW